MVDDETVITDLFREIFELRLPSCRVDVANDGHEGLRLFEALHHAVAVVDLHMPVMDGLTAYRHIDTWCREHHWETPAILFCTGYAPGPALQKILSSDPRHALLMKPVSVRKLADFVGRRIGLPPAGTH